MTRGIGGEILGSLIVSAFAVVGDVLRSKGFAGLFGAAPSVALATLSLTLLSVANTMRLFMRSMIAKQLNPEGIFISLRGGD